MLRQKNYLALGLLGCVLLLLSATTADNSVYILSKYGHQQQLTSTTLRWLPAHHIPNEKQIVVGGFEKISNAEDDNNANQADKLETKSQPPIYVCRAMHSNSVWVAGMQRHKEKRCTVTMHGAVQSYEKYELLENADGAARITWVSWNKYTQPPVGAVYANKLLIARYEIPTEEKSRYTHYIGTLSSTENFGNIVYANENGKEETATCGELLVETEPIRYELSVVKLNWYKKHDIKPRVSRVLNEVTIVNRGTQAAKMAEASTYSYKYTIYWGRRHAMLNGLDTTITLFNGTSLPNITWGTRHEENRTEAYNILIFLEPGTGVNVTLRANYTNMEVPYTATLISHYEDGATTSRPINGYRQEETLFDIKPEFGPIYFLNNYSLVPTTVPPPTTTEPTTTTTIATTKQPQETTHQHGTTEPDVNRDENMIIPKKPDISTGMQSDDGGPLSLKNKVEVTYGGTACATFKSSLLTLPLLLLILHRIT
ncbi:protein unzipped isoform X2 [Linepithema humile]|nr:PREDICTED: protein unzipped [Linepithema humile]